MHSNYTFKKKALATTYFRVDDNCWAVAIFILHKINNYCEIPTVMACNKAIQIVYVNWCAELISEVKTVYIRWDIEGFDD